MPEQVLALLDTSCVIEYPDNLDTVTDTAAISTLTVAELAHGVASARSTGRRRT